MPFTVAVAGKGGTGKTTFAALLIRHLIEKRHGSILALDADPNSNLNEALGLEVPLTIADFIEETKARGGRVVAVGTTCVRALESAADEDGRLRAGSGWTSIFIYPGYRFKVLEALITNFHLPRSTLLMLVSAFAGRETVLGAYREALAEGYRFFSFGDAMMIV